MDEAGLSANVAKMKEKVQKLPEERSSLRNLPSLNQTQFIQLWKSLYDMFIDNPNEQALYHSLATVGTLLLQIGEVRKKLALQKAEMIAEAMLESASNSVADESQKLKDEKLQKYKDEKSLAIDVDSQSDWMINFEQVLASILTEETLVAYFEQKPNLTELIEKFRTTRFQRQDSSVAVSSMNV